MIPFIDLKAQQNRIRERIDARIKSVLDHGAYIMGPEVGELESALSDFCSAQHTITCSNGTDALWLPMLALGTGPGDAVFIPSCTFAATAEAVCLTGATPVFVDVDETFFTMDTDSLEAAIEMVLKDGMLCPKAIMPVDLFGVPADYAAIGALAKRHDMTVVADAAQSFGARTGNRRVGTLAHFTATSFFPAKPLGCYGDGGAIFTDDSGMDEILRSLRVHGRSFQDKYDNIRVGTNARLDTIQAAILLEKLTLFPEELELRQRVADRYAERLADVVAIPRIPEGSTSAWAQYTIRTRARNELADALKSRGIPSAVYYPRPLHLQSPYLNFPHTPGGLAVTEKLADEVLSLPMSPYLTIEDQDRIIAAVREFTGWTKTSGRTRQA